GAVGIALVDDPIPEREQPGDVPFAVIIVERHERQIALRGAVLLQLRRGGDLASLAAVVERLIAAGVKKELGAGPGPFAEVYRFTSDEPGGSENADAHGPVDSPAPEDAHVLSAGAGRGSVSARRPRRRL